MPVLVSIVVFDIQWELPERLLVVPIMHFSVAMVFRHVKKDNVGLFGTQSGAWLYSDESIKTGTPKNLTEFFGGILFLASVSTPLRVFL